MEDPKKFLSPSSPNNISPSGNNENVSEFKRNSEHRNKKSFMEPTISAASKSITPNKKKILAERKPPKMGIISDSNPRKSVSKIPSFSEDESFLPDSSANSTTTLALPYDPLTNYLSPRPKFLRYNPNRKRKIVIRRERENGSSSSSGSTLTVSPKRVSLDSESSCNVVENEGNLDQEMEDEVEEEEEMGLKWVFLKWVFVISGLIFCTMYISSMNNSAAINSEKIDVQDFWNLTSGIVALRSTDSGGYWVSEFDAESEIPRENFGRFEENQVPFKPEEQNLNVEFNSEIEFSEDFRVLEGIHQNKDFDAISTEEIVDNEPFDYEEDNLNAEFNSERDYPENIRVLRAFPKIKDFDGVLPEKTVETAESKNEVMDFDFDSPVFTLPEPRLVDLEERVHHLTENEGEFVDDIDGIKKVIFDEIDGIKELNFDEMEWSKNVIIWILRLTALVLLLMGLVLFYKCKKAFTEATASNRMRNSAPVMEERDESFMNPEAVLTDSMPVGSVECREEQVKNTPPIRRIPKATQLSEIEYGGGESSGIVQRRGDSVYAVTDVRKAKKSKQEDVKEEGGGTSVRRSQRLQAREAASP